LVVGGWLLRDAISRRTLVRSSATALGAGSGALLAACGSRSDRASSSGGGRGDVALLNSLLELEQLAIAAYTAGIGILRTRALGLGRRILQQEHDHANRLSVAIALAAGTPVAPRERYDFPRVEAQADVLALGASIENAAIAAYIDAIPMLSTPDLRATAASIVTDDAEHLALLDAALGRDPLPSALVAGRRA
jgi:rubrerythrin